MMIRRSGVLAALSVVLFLAGCAGNTADTGAAGQSSSAPVPAPSTASPAPSSPGDATAIPEPKTTGSAKPDAGAVETLTGQVIAGVEPGCLVLTGTRGAHLLIVTGDMTKTVKVGDTVTVTGRSDPGMVTTCQQGTPFVVTAVK
jgi:hypothetical protein